LKKLSRVKRKKTKSSDGRVGEKKGPTTSYLDSWGAWKE